jgi:hypothetical protein
VSYYYDTWNISLLTIYTDKWSTRVHNRHIVESFNNIINTNMKFLHAQLSRAVVVLREISCSHGDRRLYSSRWWRHWTPPKRRPVSTRQLASTSQQPPTFIGALHSGHIHDRQPPYHLIRYGFDYWQGQEVFCLLLCQNRPWVPRSLLTNGYKMA